MYQYKHVIICVSKIHISLVMYKAIKVNFQLTERLIKRKNNILNNHILDCIIIIKVTNL